MNREDWLAAVAKRMTPWFGTLPPLRFAIGFPSTGKKGKAIGECWDRSASGDQHFEVLIRPDLAEPVEVAAVLAHELVHAVVGIKAGHGSAFRKVATGIGLEGKMTATVPGEAFKRSVAPILAEVGPLPHARLQWGGDSTGPKKQGTRLVKVACPECGYTVRITRKWLEQGAPLCPTHMLPLAEEGQEEEPGEGED